MGSAISGVRGGIAGLQSSGIPTSTVGMRGLSGISGGIGSMTTSAAAYASDFKVSGGIAGGSLAPAAIGGAAVGATGLLGGLTTSPAVYSSAVSGITGGAGALSDNLSRGASLDLANGGVVIV